MTLLIVVAVVQLVVGFGLGVYYGLILDRDWPRIDTTEAIRVARVDAWAEGYLARMEGDSENANPYVSRR